MVVALHLKVEHLGLAGARGGDEVLVQQLQDALADVAQPLLHLLLEWGVSESRFRGESAGQCVWLSNTKPATREILLW